MLGSNILQSLNGSINSMWVGRFLGARALAATTSANLIMFLLFAGVFGLAMATSILVGQSAGRGEVAKIRRAVGTSGGLFLIAGVLITIARSEEHTSELQSLMRISYAVFCLKKKTKTNIYK